VLPLLKELGIALNVEIPDEASPNPLDAAAVAPASQAQRGPASN